MSSQRGICGFVASLVVLAGLAIEGCGGANWFLKCTGPEKTMRANRGAFDGMVGSMRLGR